MFIRKREVGGKKKEVRICGIVDTALRLESAEFITARTWSNSANGCFSLIARDYSYFSHQELSIPECEKFHRRREGEREREKE